MAVQTGGTGKEIQLAMQLLLQAREKLVVAQHHLMDGNYVIQTIAVGAALDAMLEAISEVGS